jgi:glycosyltransferase involved in cell wall biosynthesis
VKKADPHVNPGLALLPWADRFEDFYDKIGVSLQDFGEKLTGTWLFNYVRALQIAGVRPVIYFASARIVNPLRFTHRHTGAAIRVVRTPWLHRKLQGACDRLRIESSVLASTRSYVATPWRALLAEMRQDRCDAILCQEYEYPRFDEAIVAARVLGIPVFATYQAGNRPRSVIERPLRGVAVRRAAGLFIASRREADRVRSTYRVPAERIALVPNAVDVSQWRPGDRQQARAALGIPLNARVVVWHGRVEIHYKGLDVLLDAWQQVYAARPDAGFLLLLVGSGQDREVLRRDLASLPPDAVRWEDRWVHDPAVIRQYLAAGDVAILSSRHEGFAVAVIEAMACGLPVVATDVPGVAEALGDQPTGFIVPSEDPRALADALQRILDDEPLRHRLSSRARRRAEDEFSLERVGRQLRSFMERRGAFQSVSGRLSDARGG